MYRRAHFTLIEVLIVVIIVAGIGSMIAINAVKAIYEQRFNGEVELLVDKLRLAQDLMIIYHANVKVVLTADEDDGYSLQLLPEIDLPSKHFSDLKKVEKMKYIRHISYSGMDNQAEQLELKFCSHGSNMADGSMRLSTTEVDHPGSFTRYINFPGYPIPIFASVFDPDIDEEDATPFLQELTNRTIEAVRARENI